MCIRSMAEWAAFYYLRDLSAVTRAYYLGGRAILAQKPRWITLSAPWARHLFSALSGAIALFGAIWRTLEALAGQFVFLVVDGIGASRAKRSN
jgi:hypothetical protein